MNCFLVFILIILIGTYFLEILVDILNVRHIQTNLPLEFKGFYDAEKYSQSQKYLQDNTRFGIIKSSVIVPAAIAFMLLGGFNAVDHLARSVCGGSITAGLVFTGVLIFASEILGLPFSIYQTFVIEEKYGFNRTTLKTFILDVLKSWLLIVIIGGVVLSAVIWFFEKTGQWAWLICWAVLTLFQLFIIFIAPVVIMPIFNKFAPLEDGDLKKAIEDYAASQNFKMRGVFKMDGSRRSTKSNAFFTGLGKFRRIVLFDTLIEKHSVNELVCILAHEMGHYQKGHILKSLFVAILSTGLMFFMLSLFINNRQLFDAFRMEHTSVYASLIFFGFLYAPVEMILSIFKNTLSRAHEYAADAYAVLTLKKPEAMISALKKLTVENLSNLTPHPLKVILEYSHPPVLERIKSIRGITVYPEN
jgi:STE24 endopeptidase